MLFNSIEFLIFLPIVLGLYYLLRKNFKAQNILLLAASYLFYGWWDWRFLGLIVISSTADFFVGYAISQQKFDFKRKLLLAVLLIMNLSVLGFFKYYNFFIDSFADAFTYFGHTIEPSRLNIILPVGISFYTFQTLSYSIDIYRGKLEPTKNYIAFLSFISFFPQLVAGPIERASNLLPQFLQKRTFDSSKLLLSLKQILWGFFKKVVIADQMAIYVEHVYSNPAASEGLALLLGTFFFAIQIYCDFSGYSDIALGVSRLFGIELMVNFRTPYFSLGFNEFWKRWHISLSSWMKDYVYISLGGNHQSKIRTLLNIFSVFLISGLWHGANWTFVIWGFLHGTYRLIEIIIISPLSSLILKQRKNLRKLLRPIGILLTFLLTCFAWIFFRASTLEDAFTVIQQIAYNTSFSSDSVKQAILVFTYDNTALSKFIVAFGLIAVLFIYDFGVSFRWPSIIHNLSQIRFVKFMFWYFVAMAILLFGEFGATSFIYFQF